MKIVADGVTDDETDAETARVAEREGRWEGLPVPVRVPTDRAEIRRVA